MLAGCTSTFMPPGRKGSASCVLFVFSAFLLVFLVSNFQPNLKTPFPGSWRDWKFGFFCFFVIQDLDPGNTTHVPLAPWVRFLGCEKPAKTPCRACKTEALASLGLVYHRIWDEVLEARALRSRGFPPLPPNHPRELRIHTCYLWSSKPFEVVRVRRNMRQKPKTLLCISRSPSSALLPLFWGGFPY